MSELLYDFGVLLKPKVLLAMLALYLTTFFTSSIYYGSLNINYLEFFTGFMAVAFSVSGANALNCVYDVDIDTLMVRTSGRPLVKGTISLIDASHFSWIMLGISATIAIYLGLIPILLLIEGALSYLVIYTLLIKRKSSINVLFTAPSVAAPAWFGWYLGGAPLYPVGLVMGLLVAIWGPLHLWSIAFAYDKDYERAKVPMFPIIVKKEKAMLGIFSALILLLTSSYLLCFWADSIVYLIGVSTLNIVLLVAGFRLLKKGTKHAGWVLFKLTSPYIILVFAIFMLSQYLF